MASSSFRFGTYRLNPARRELRRAGKPVGLPARAVSCIAYLIEHRDRAVSRDELIAAVWPRVVVSNNILDQTIAQARRALGDSGDERRMIRTIHGFGYAWGIEVESIDADAAEPASRAVAVAAADVEPPVNAVEGSEGAAPQPAAGVDAAAIEPVAHAPPTPRFGTRWRLWSACGLVFAATLLSAALFRSRGGTHAPARKATLVVLPVAVPAGEPQAWMRLGLMDAVAERLHADGHPVMPVDNVVAVTAGTANPSKKQLTALTDSDPTRVLIRPTAERIDANRWKVTLDVRHGDAFSSGETGEAAEVLTAARVAADRLSLLLGVAPRPDRVESPQSLALQEQLHAVDAARLESRVDDARALLDMLPPAQREEPEAVLMRGFVDLAAGDFAAARTTFGRLLDEHPLQTSAFVEARALWGKGVALSHLSEVEPSIVCFDKALALLERDTANERDDWLGRVFGARGLALMLRDDAQASLADQARARTLFEMVGDKARLSALDNNVGWMSLQRSRFSEALPMLERAAAESVPLNTVSVELRARVGIVRAKLGLLDPGGALEQDARIEELLLRVPGTTVQHLAIGWRIRLLMANGRLQAADRWVDVLSHGADPPGEEQLAPWGLGLAAQRAYADGRTREAAALAAQSIARDWGTSYDPREYALTLLVLLRAQLARGERAAAAATLAQARAWTPPDTMTSVPSIYRALLEAEAQAGGIGDGDPRANFERALELADASQTPADMFEVCRAYADHLIAAGDLAAAAEVVGRTSAWSIRDFDAALLEARLYHALGNASLSRSALARADALAGERKAPADLETKMTGGVSPSAEAATQPMQTLR
ncbi:MAG TPA: winged helix-turn-helix domain-containing protein [Dokdonella sp.]